MRHWILAAFLAVGLTGCFSDNDEAQKETVTLEETRDTPRGIQDGVNDVFNLVGIMDKAVPANIVYNASVTFDTNYEAQSFEVYLLNNHTNEVRPISQGELQKNKKIDFTFEEQFDQPDLTLVFRLTKGGLQFLTGQPGEFICYLDIPRPFFSKSVVCNESTSATALLAHNNAVEEFTDLLAPSTINQWKRLNGIDQRITLDMFAMVLSVFQTTMIELPMNIPFEERYTSQLPKTADIAKSMMSYISENHYLDIRFLENQVSYHYPEMEKLGFILSTSGQLWVDSWHNYFLTSEKRRKLINQFFRASNDLVFVDTQAFRVQSPVYEEKTNTIHWINWPWFESVEIFIDDVSVGLVKDGKFELESDIFNHVTFKPLGKLGKFQTIKLTKQSLLDRYHRVVEEDKFGGAYVSK
ncbi:MULTISPECIES: hypothetical protein [Vibrio]|uniref:hypothetical protein n=1 Tax=Vibrio TaxID=662 RepID=UPI00078B1CFE|nr:MULTISPECIES: hypothetical protein [Vibrio]BAU70793.1 hypothetical protein [Vibrio sp. 04Ya108]BBM67639.1 hypothetical protein VA249_42850 [Vibrio alfacsensis]BCN27121.1 hypothetical protein VYA_43130 [Vibrio alfacsensis]